MKRVLMLLTNAFMPDPRVYQEARSIIRAGHSVKIICWDRGEGLPSPDVTDGIEIERVRLVSTHGRGAIQAVFLLIVWIKMLLCAARERFDVIFCHDFDTLPAGLLLRVLSGKKLIFDSHEVYSKMLGQNVPRTMKAAIERFEKVFIKRADWIIVTCPAMEGLYRSFGAGSISIIGNWKAPSDFNIHAAVLDEERHILGIKDELVVVYIANLGKERIIAPLLEVVAGDKEIFLIIGGTGSQSVIAEEAGRRCANIRYLGYVPPNKVPLYTKISDVVYYGYSREAGMADYNSPNKLFEAVAAGKAFLGGNFGEMGKVVGEEKCGIALDNFTKESIAGALAVLKDRTKLEAFKSNAARAGVDKYNWIIAEKELLNIFEKIK